MIGWLAVAAAAAPCASVADGRLTGAEALQFVSGKAELVDPSAVELIACALRDHPELAVQIAVHSDSQGSEAFNLRLTHDRAAAVAAALVARGVAGDRVVAAGFGEMRPIAPNATAEGRAQNRRIELWVDRSRWGEPPPVAPAPVPAPVPAPADPCRVVLGCAERTCRVALAPADAAELAAQCLAGEEPLQDGAEWFVRVPSGVVRVAPDGDGAVLTPDR